MTDDERQSRPGRHRRLDASMTLLTAVMERPLDPAYEAAARKRADSGDPGPSLRRRLIVLVLATLTGLGIVVAAQQLRTPNADEVSARDLMIEQIRDRSATNEELRNENAELREEISDLQSQVLGPEAEEFLSRTSDLEVAVGVVPVTGPGLVVTIEDSTRALEGDSADPEGRVRDYDLQVVVNGLWASGAEAVAVNGYRLTSLTAIRSAGEAVLVDLQPLTSPYAVEAIGDPDALRTNFARSSAQVYLNSLAATHSIPNTVNTEEQMRLPAAGSRQLSYVTPVE